MNLAAIQKRLEKVEAARGKKRVRVICGPFGGDVDAAIEKAVADGWARRDDLFIYVNRYSEGPYYAWGSD